MSTLINDPTTQKYRMEMPYWPVRPLGMLPGDGRSRTKSLLARLGNPHLKLPPVVHVAGTNGKGSTIAFLRAMLEAAGYKVHVYTSPHLLRFNERIVLAGKEIEDDALSLLLEEVRQAAEGMPVEVFDGHTAAAFLAFSRVPADIVLIETGMGGRFDPTNVIPSPAVTIITGISRDHVEALGKSLKEIAWHKAGIMREGVPCIVGAQPDEAMQSLAREALAVGAPLHIGGLHWGVEEKIDGNGFTFHDGNGEVELPQPSLRGLHQYMNAGNAVAAITLLDGFEVPEEAIFEGLRKAKWVGRMELMRSPGKGFELWFDGAHNAGGAVAIANYAHRAGHDKPLYLICGTTRGKDAAGLLLPFIDLAKIVHTVPVQAEPDSYTAEEMAVYAHMAGIEQVAESATVREAIDHIIQNHPPGRILVFGSLFLRIEMV